MRTPLPRPRGRIRTTTRELTTRKTATVQTTLATFQKSRRLGIRLPSDRRHSLRRVPALPHTLRKLTVMVRMDRGENSSLADFVNILIHLLIFFWVLDSFLLVGIIFCFFSKDLLAWFSKFHRTLTRNFCLNFFWCPFQLFSAALFSPDLLL